jgi:2-dehydro-3-deoxygluconokinase
LLSLSAALDRIGGGDGFVGGMLYAILKGWASGVLATTMLTNSAQLAADDQDWNIWKGTARVQR